MTFTDDDLQRLKERLNTMLPRYEMRPSLAPVEVLALIGRLEAAEVCAQSLANIKEPYLEKWEIKALQTWRKAAGKS